MAEPDALGIVRDVLDLVRDRPHVDVAQVRERLPQRLALDVQAEDARRDPPLELGVERRDEDLGLERRVAGRLRAERVEARAEMAVHADRLDERDGCRDRAQEIGVRLGGGSGSSCGRLGCRHGRRRSRRSNGCGCAVRVRTSPFPSAAGGRRRADEIAEAGKRLEHALVRVLEERAPLGRDGLGVLEVLLEDEADVARVQAGDLRRRRHDLVVAGRPGKRRGARPQYRRASVAIATVIPRTNAAAPTKTATAASVR